MKARPGLVVGGSVGDDRFVVTEPRGGAWVIDSGGEVVAPLIGTPGPCKVGFFVGNRKWLVWVDKATYNASLVLWKMSGGMPLVPGVALECTIPIYGRGARFSPFHPCSDELVAVTVENCESNEENSSLIGFDLAKSIEAGVPFVTKKYPLPKPHPIDLVWPGPDTVLTMHVFPWTKYKQLASIFPSHIAAVVLSQADPNQRESTTLTEVYSAYDMTQFGCQIEHSEDERIFPTDEGIYALQIPSPTAPTTVPVNIYDATTGIHISTITITQPRL
ncbi:hypothetical protein Pelo_17059 [Pelomyxa schiedti]|nr:hypothetical protein Pelo_17059 [Pelomyxa schiedti]